MKTRNPVAGLPFFRTLTGRVVSVVMATVIAFSVVLGFGLYSTVTRWQADHVMESLAAMATARQHAIEAEVERFSQVGNAFVAPDLSREIEELQAAEGAEAETLREALLQSMLRKLRANPLLEHVQVMDLEDEVIIQSHPGRDPFLDVDADLLREGALRLTVSTPHVPPVGGGNYHVEILVPLMDTRGNTIALLVLRKSIAHILSITGDYTGLGQTGETELGKRTGDEINFLLPLRFAADPTLVGALGVAGGVAAPMIRATAGQAGVTRSLDYRGEPVVAAFRPIAQTGWGLVVKQDEAELYSAARELGTSVILLLLALCGLSAAVVIPLLLGFTRPLRQLGDAMGEVLQGNLDVQVPESTDREMGALTHGFNMMIRRVRDSQSDLERRNEELGAFAHVVSHDLKAPLRGVASLAQWLEEDLGDRLDEESRGRLDLMRERVSRMDALINGLLDFARAGQAKSEPIRVNIERLVETVVADLGPMEGMTVETVTSLPVVFGDEIRLRQVFQNLIGNAVNHHPGPTGSVEISCAGSGDMWEFSVRDDGDGIDPRHHERIFMIFERLRTPHEADSTGVGLAVTKKIVENAGGTIRVESDGVSGAGATFHFTWPKNGGRPR